MITPVYEITDAMLASIRVLFRRDDSLCLYGITYDMRPGQSPGDIWRASKRHTPMTTARDWEHAARWPRSDFTSEWIWLGSPGWWGHMSRESQARVKAWLAVRASRDEIPDGPFEWSRIERDLTRPALPAPFEIGQRVRYTGPAYLPAAPPAGFEAVIRDNTIGRRGTGRIINDVIDETEDGASTYEIALDGHMRTRIIRADQRRFWEVQP